MDKTKYKEAQAKVRKRIWSKKGMKGGRKTVTEYIYISWRRKNRKLENLRINRKKDIIKTIIPQAWEVYFRNLLTYDRPEYKDISCGKQ